MRSPWLVTLCGGLSGGLFGVAATGCATLLGDFSVGTGAADAADESVADAIAAIDGTTSGDASPEATPGDATVGMDAADAGRRAPDSGAGVGNADAAIEGAVADALPRDATGNVDAQPGDASAEAAMDASCAPGLTLCPSGCTNLSDAAANCGACGHGCNGASCAGSTCGAYVIAQQPTTGTVAKLATDGTRVVWADTGIVAINQIAATGGAAIALAPVSIANGAVGAELALAGSTVAFVYLGVSAPSVGLATVDVADSGISVFPGALSVSAISLNPAATHVFFVDVTGTQGSLNDCAVSGRDAGACTGVAGGGRFLGQTAADDSYMLFDVTGADTLQAGVYLDTIAMNAASIFTPDVSRSLAVDGTWAYWTVQNEGGATYALRRTLESAPGTVVQTVASSIASIAFATDGADVFYWNGSAIASKPVAGGNETPLASATGFAAIAVGGGILVWSDGATIWGMALAAH